MPLYLQQQNGAIPPRYKHATAMQATLNYRISIYNVMPNNFIVEFINLDNTKVIGHVKTTNFNAINRIRMNTALRYDHREANAVQSIGGYTLNEAYEALEYEFINQ